MCRPRSIPADRRRLGNWATMSFNGSTHSSTFNSQNQLVTNGPTSSTLAYDPNGNTTTDENGNALHYDLWNRMTSWTDHLGSTTNTYSYDGLGRRYGVAFTGAAVADPAPDTAWLLSLAGQVLTEAFARSGTETVEYDEVWSPVYVNAMVCRDEWDQESIILSGHGGTEVDGPSTRIYPRTDANYDVTSLVGSTDGTTWTTVERDLYTPYGVRTVTSATWSGASTGSTVGFTQGFQGGFYDAGSGLVLFNAGGAGRFYDAASERWLRQDSLFYVDGSNLYSAYRDEPKAGVDPKGTITTAKSRTQPKIPKHKVLVGKDQNGEWYWATGSETETNLMYAAAKQCLTCTDVGIIQFYERRNERGQAVDNTADANPRPPGFVVDNQYAGMSSYYQDNYKDGEYFGGFGATGPGVTFQWSYIQDVPTGVPGKKQTIVFYDVAICRSTGAILGIVTWSVTFPGNNSGSGTLDSAPKIPTDGLPPGIKSQLTPIFIK